MGDGLTKSRDVLAAFAEERNPGQFHSIKNQASALSVEAAKLTQHFQWLAEEQSRDLSPEAKIETHPWRAKKHTDLPPNL